VNDFWRRNTTKKWPKYTLQSTEKGTDDMLILTRKIGETIVIGDHVTVTVLGIKSSQVRMGINAPKEVEVHREEIYQRIQNDKQQKSELDTDEKM